MSQNHRLPPPSRTLSYLPLYLSSLSPRGGKPWHNLSDNRSIPLLSSSSFLLLPEEAFYLCITGSQYPLISFCIFSVFLVISFRSLENHRFHQQLSCKQFPCQRETCNGAVVAWFISHWFIFLYKYCSSFSRPLWCFSFQAGIEVTYKVFIKVVKFFSQKPLTPSGTWAFQFGIFFNIFFSFYCKICTRACFSFFSIILILQDINHR